MNEVVLCVSTLRDHGKSFFDAFAPSILYRKYTGASQLAIEDSKVSVFHRWRFSFQQCTPYTVTYLLCKGSIRCYTPFVKEYSRNS